METGPKKDEESIYHAALSMPAIERSAFLEKQCEGDEELLSRIEILLANSEEVGDFLINSQFCVLLLSLKLFSMRKRT